MAEKKSKNSRKKSGSARCAGTRRRNGKNGVKKTKEALLESEARLRAVFENCRDAIGVSKVGSHVFVNPAYLRLFGYPENTDLKDRPILDLIAPGSRAEIQRKVEARAGGQEIPCTYETRGLRLDGTEFDMEVNASSYVENGELHTLVILRDITGRNRARKALEKSEKMLHTIIEAVPECVKLLDQNGNVILMNRAGLAMIQADSLGQVKGRCVCPLLAPQYAEEFMDLTRRVFSGETGTILFEITGLKGRHLWLETHAVPLRNEKDEIIALLGITRDVTESRRAEAEMREKESRYRVLFESANDGIFINDGTGFIDCNQRGADMYGLPKDKIIGRSPSDFSPERQPDGRLSAEVAAEKIRAALSGAPQIFEWQPLRADGTPFDVEVTLSRLEIERRVCLQAIVRDFSERKRAEQALRVSERRFRSIIEHATLGILVADAETRQIRYANPELCRVMGCTDLELRSLRATDLAVKEEQPSAVEGFRAHAEGRLHATERTFQRKDGSTIRVQINSVPMELEGRPCLVAFITDITQRRLLEEEQLKTQKLESIGTLAGGIAHDFNNLLQGVFGYISMAKSAYDQKEKSLSMLSQAEEALHLAVSLTGQLLTFSKGGKPLKKLTRLGPVIENAVKFALSGSRTDSRIDIEDGLWAVEADKGQVAQVVQNIVLNADEAMAGRGTVDVTVRNVNIPAGSDARLPGGGRFISIAIQDSGTGIPEKNLARIFDPYFTTKQKGSGLGLATSYSIIRNHGGAIDVRSGANEGSTFIIYLPAGDGDPGAGETSPPMSAALKKGRILVMDDEEVVRSVATDMIASLGHEVETAPNGNKALELFVRAREEGRPFDLVIVDLTVKGGMGGEETVRRMREVDPGIPAVVSSGYAESPVVAEYRDHGFSSCLNKPYQLAALRDCLNSLL